jgi:plastocyanin
MFRSLFFLISAGLISFSVTVQAKDHLLVQKDKKFKVTSIDISAGDSVTFKNDEKDLTHNVYSLGPKNPFEIQIQEPGKSSTVTFTEKGTTEVECAIHPSMKIKINVK